jgi:hypothetical protein
MNWKFVKPLVDENTISEFEKIIGKELPDELKSDIKNYNAGRPEKRLFDTEKSQNKMVKGLLSFNKNDTNNVFSALEWNIGPDNKDDFIVIGLDPFGNFICLDKDLEEIVYIYHDNFRIELIAENYKEFIEKLH